MLLRQNFEDSLKRETILTSVIVVGILKMEFKTLRNRKRKRVTAENMLPLSLLALEELGFSTDTASLTGRHLKASKDQAFSS